MGKVVYLILFGLIISSMSLRLQMQQSASGSITNLVEKYHKQNVRNIANAGANVALNTLTVNVEETNPASNVSLYDGSYSYYIERDTEDATLGPTEVRVTSIGKYKNLVDSVIVLLTRPSFSRFAYFSNHEGNIWFADGDTLRGPVHTNTYFQMAGRPVFYGKVTSHEVYNSSNPYRKYPWGATNPDFRGGTEWKVPELPMPSEIPQELVDAAQVNGIHINNKYAWIEFQADGTVRIAAKNSSSTPTPGQYTTYNLSSFNGVIYVKYNSSRPTVKVQGTVNGNATIGTSGSIEITGNIVYAEDPFSNPNSDDMLGLAAARDIIVINNQHDVDRTIHATIMTMNPAVASAKNFWVDRYKNDRYGTLHLLGGLIQNSRGAVGLVGSATSRKGYLKDYRWDPRLQKMNPPFFPALFVLRKLAWWD